MANETKDKGDQAAADTAAATGGGGDEQGAADAGVASADAVTIEAVTADRDAALAKIEEQAEALTAAEGERDQARADLEAMTTDRDAKAKDLETANATVDDLRAQLAKATKAVGVSRKARPAKARAAGPMKDGLSGDALLEALRDSASEIVFSNGATEIDVLEPLQVVGPAWVKSAAGVVLTMPVTIKPDRRITLAGFALLDGKGKQLAFAPLRGPLTVQANQEMRLDRQIVFP